MMLPSFKTTGRNSKQEEIKFIEGSSLAENLH